MRGYTGCLHGAGVARGVELRTNHRVVRVSVHRHDGAQNANGANSGFSAEQL